MGIDYTTHLGPYIECRAQKVTSFETIRACTSETCDQYKKRRWKDESVKYCDRCGAAVGNVNFPVETDNVDEDSVCEELSDRLYVLVEADGVHYWVSNVRQSPGITFDPREGEQLLQATPELIATEWSNFINFFAKEIDVLRKNYGDDNVKVKWGLIHAIH